MKIYPPNRTFRTKSINFFRNWFRNRPCEKILINLFSHFKIAGKFVPPEYLYQRGTHRIKKSQRGVFHLDVSDVVDHSFYFFDHYFVPDKFFRLIQPNWNIVDIGAHSGVTSIRAASHAPQGNVFAFEPASSQYNRLCKNISLNPGLNVFPVKKALGHEVSTGKLYEVNPNNLGMNRILNAAHELPFEWIEISTLDLEMEKFSAPKIDLIKIDAEGFELNVLKGARNTIERDHPIMVIEVVDVNLQQQGTNSFKLIEYLKGLGYHTIDLKTNQPVVDSLAMETDILCYTDRNPL